MKKKLKREKEINDEKDKEIKQLQEQVKEKDKIFGLTGNRSPRSPTNNVADLQKI